jgi:hypothetical protein
MCKSHVHIISRKPADQYVGVFEILGLDFCCPMSVSSLRGRRYNFCAVDFLSRFMLHNALRSKDEALASFRRMSATIRSIGYTVRRFRVDNGIVFLGAIHFGPSWMSSISPWKSPHLWLTSSMAG